MTRSETASTARVRPRAIPGAAATNPNSIPAGNVATSAPMTAGPASVASEICGRTGAMTL